MLESIDYKNIFKYFEEISRVPRGSYHNEKISAYLVDFAKEHKLEYRTDEACNVVIKKPGSADAAGKPPVMLQGHMDMVCVSEDGTHDFEREGLELRVDGDYIEAKGTTLGGDDGIAIAYILAILDGDEYSHPPIEAVFTTDEEVGMEGAAALDTSDLKAEQLINIDNEEEGVLLVSCAGGASVDVEFTGERKEAAGAFVKVSVSGLAGGHSGTEINKHPLNASIFLGRLLATAFARVPFRLVSFSGGDKDNVITREASARLYCEVNVSKLCEDLTEVSEALTEEVRSQEPALEVAVSEPEQGTELCFDETFTRAALSFLNLVITGVQVYSADVPGMVESSLNMGIAGTHEGGLRLGFAVRSQKKTYKDYMIDKVRGLAKLVAGEDDFVRTAVRGNYPAWDYRRDSRLRDLMVREFQACFGREPRVQGIHAGLECGLLSEKMPELDIVSIGPEIRDIHTVKERMSISSAKKNFDYILRVLAELAK